MAINWALASVGLSPRVRGSPGQERIGRRPSGSIPACAGEPSAGARVPIRSRVYPRVCGGAHSTPRHRKPVRGLSPRVRGSHHPLHAHPEAVGSIPACAGEPLPDRTVTLLRRVYPRVCGGAQAVGPHAPLSKGLSPRVRGSRRITFTRPILAGSIPACAGEPSGGGGASASPGVYPRVCGGACLYSCRGSHIRGLSPRVRGSHRQNATP